MQRLVFTKRIRFKTLAIISVTIIGLILGLLMVSATIVSSGYSALEKNQIEGELGTLQKTIARDQADLHTNVVDWGVWDETYQFVESPDQKYLDATLGNSTFEYLRVDLMMAVWLNGTIIYERSYLPDRSEAANGLEGLTDHLMPNGRLMTSAVKGEDVTGLIVLPEGPMIISSTGVRHSDGSGPINGVIVMGRWLNMDELKLLENVTFMKLRISTMEDPGLNSVLGHSGMDELNRTSMTTKAISDQEISGYVLIPDIYGTNGAVVEASIPRDIYQQSKSMDSYLVTALSLSGIIFGLVIVILLETSVVSRVSRLSDNVREIAESGDSTRRVFSKGQDEISELAENINGMLFALDSAQTELVAKEKESRDQLEGLVNERTKMLVVTNGALQTEIAERRKTEEDLRESESRYRAIVEDQTDLLVRLSPDGTITFANPAFVRYIGIGVPDLVGKDFAAIVMKDTADQILQEVSRITPDEPLVSHQLQITRKSGEVRWINWTGRGIFDDSRKLVEIQAVGNDITERIKLEQELFKTEKLESLGRMAGGIAHDFNNMLTSIIGNITIAEQEDGVSGGLKKRLRSAEESVMRAKDLTLQLLTFSEGGAPVKKRVATEGLVRGTVELSLHGSPVKASYEFPSGIWDVEVDAGQIGQMIHNLARNAVDAMPSGGVVDVSARNFETPGNHGLPLGAGKYVVVSIRDHGVGIPAEDRASVFDPFFTTKPNGSGLGLSAARSIAVRHGGYLDLDAEVDDGALFKAYLPALEPVKGEMPSAKPARSEGARVLLMDDEESILEVVSDLLTMLGHEVERAHDGREALDMYRRAKDEGEGFDLVIMDLTIPGGMGGKEAIGRLLEIDPLACAVVSSGYSNDPVMADFASFGFKDVLQKPYTMKELKATLDRMLRERRAG